MNHSYKFQQTENMIHKLMPHRISEILLIANIYDAYILEQDGQLVEEMYSNFHDFQFICTPRIIQVSTYKESLQILENRSVDIVIIMGSIIDADVFTITQGIKSKRPLLPVVLLLNKASMIESVTAQRSLFDGIFFWTGDTILFSTIIRYIEDRLNTPDDLATGLVKLLLVLDDHVTSYSQLLPVMYQEVLRQTQYLLQEDANEVQKILRRQTCSKILLATNIDEAKDIYKKYSSDIMGIVCQISLHKNIHHLDGLEFAKEIRQESKDIPIILIAEQKHNTSIPVNVSQVQKDSPTFRNDLRNFMIYNMGFGDFVFRMPDDGREVARAKNIKEFQSLIGQIPDESLEYHSSHNHISLWLLARGEYALALEFRPRHTKEFVNMNAFKQYIIEAIANYRDAKQIGVVAKYKPGDWDSSFIQIGNGSLGGKGRGLAFINHLLAEKDFSKKFPQIQIRIPKTITITTEIFDQFLEQNQLRNVYTLSDDEAIAKRFLEANLPNNFVEIMKDFLQQSKTPLAIRSSSMLEDSQYLPFAGIYSTFMIPNIHTDLELRLKHLLRAIKLVYASVFFKCSRSYIEATPYKLEQEKMAVVIQEIAGQQYGDLFYPTYSGVAQSYNFYTISHMKPSDGAAQVAMGLGKTVIGGGNSVRFCPKYPANITQFATFKDTIRNAQSYFYALNLPYQNDDFTDESATLVRLDCSDAPFEVLRNVTSVIDYENDRITDDMTTKNIYRTVTFGPILRHKIIPLSQILEEILPILRDAMGKEIEMEFAGNLYHIASQKKPTFYILQVRPMLISYENTEIHPSERKQEKLICNCYKVLGNGVKSTTEIIYISPEKFDKSSTRQIAIEVGKINKIMRDRQQRYLLIGIGRWGTTDPWLGIPVDWSQISNALAIIELTISKDFFADASSGSHFFQNITALSIGYFTITGRNPKDYLDWSYLDSLPSEHEFNYIRHIHLDKEITIKIDGKTGEGIIFKPGIKEESEDVLKIASNIFE